MAPLASFAHPHPPPVLTPVAPPPRHARSSSRPAVPPAAAAPTRPRPYHNNRKKRRADPAAAHLTQHQTTAAIHTTRKQHNGNRGPHANAQSGGGRGARRAPPPRPHQTHHAVPHAVAPAAPPRTHHVTDVETCRTVVSALLREPQVAVDCEGVALSRTGRLCLIQLATATDVYLIDLVDPAGEPDPVDEATTTDTAADEEASSTPQTHTHANALFEEGGMRELLEADDVVKVVHDCRHDSDALFHQFDVTLGPVVDTQVVFGVLRRARGLPEGLPVSLRTLLKKYAGASEDELATKGEVKELMQTDARFWERRPLPESAVRYAVLDVWHLLRVCALLAAHIQAADPDAWRTVLDESSRYVALFRDDAEGPAKAAAEYEARARVARRQRAAAEQVRRVELHQKNDPMRRFAFDHSLVLQSMSINS